MWTCLILGSPLCSTLFRSTLKYILSFCSFPDRRWVSFTRTCFNSITNNNNNNSSNNNNNKLPQLYVSSSLLL